MCIEKKLGINRKKAICLFGLVRGNKKSWRSIFKFIKDNKLDVYAHFWIPNYNIKTWHKSVEKGEYINFLKCAKNYNISFRKLIIESQDECVLFEEMYNFHKNQFFMWSSIVKAKNLIEDQIYQSIFFCRTDIKIEKNILIMDDFFENKLDLLHSGYVREGKVECEDLFFAVRAIKLDVLDKIQINTIDAYYFKNNIRNPLIYEFKSDFYRPFEFAHSISLIRKKDYLARLRNKFF